jgi:hypothetical protein
MGLDRWGPLVPPFGDKRRRVRPHDGLSAASSSRA